MLDKEEIDGGENGYEAGGVDFGLIKEKMGWAGFFSDDEKSNHEDTLIESQSEPNSLTILDESNLTTCRLDSGQQSYFCPNKGNNLSSSESQTRTVNAF